MLFPKRRKARFDEVVYSGDDAAGDISLDGNGYSDKGRSLWGFKPLGRRVSGDDLTMRGRNINLSTDDSGSDWLEFES